jgi:hypothetical protein
MKKRGIIMKKSIIALAILALLGFAGIAMADPTDNATSHVFLNIVENIAVSAIDANIAAANLQTGEVSLPIRFRVDANTEAVDLSVLVTKLYKGDDPAGTEVTPINPSGTGVIIDPANANEMNGGDGVAEYVGGGNIVTAKGNFVGSMTQEVIFESSQSGHFSQDVVVIPAWSNSDDEKPVGQYSGYVVLYAAVVGDGGPVESTGN